MNNSISQKDIEAALTIAKANGNQIRINGGVIEYQTTCYCGGNKKWLEESAPNGWGSVCCQERARSVLDRMMRAKDKGLQMNDKREEVVWQLLDLQITSIVLKQMTDAKRLNNAIRFTDSGVEFQTTCKCGKLKEWANKPNANGWWGVCCNE